jgi:integrase
VAAEIPQAPKANFLAILDKPWTNLIMARQPKNSSKIPSGIDRHGELWRVRISRKGFQVRETFPSLDEAILFRAKTMADIKGNSFRDKTKEKRTTLVQLLQEYLEKETPKKKGSRTETNRIKQWQKVVWAKLPVIDVMSSHVTAWRDAQAAKGLAPSTIGNMMNTLSKVFRVAKAEWSYAIENPVRDIARPKKRRPRVAVPDDNLEGRLTEEALKSKRPWLAYFLSLSAWTAIREGEIRFLRLSDLDFENYLIAVRAEEQGGSKTDEPRDVPMLDHAVAVLQGWLRIRPATPGEDWLFPSPRNPENQISLNTVSCGFNQLMKKVFEDSPEDRKPQKITFHDLRHWGTTRMAPLHFGEIDLSKTTGHKTPQVLRGYYNPDPVERSQRVRDRAAALKKAKSQERGKTKRRTDVHA